MEKKVLKINRKASFNLFENQAAKFQHKGSILINFENEKGFGKGINREFF